MSVWARWGARLERWLVGEAAGVPGRPRVSLGPATAGPASAAAGSAAVTLAAALVPAESAAGPLGPGDLRRGVAERRAHVVDLDFVDGALLAFLGLIRPLPQPPRDDDPHPALQALGHILGRLPPDVTGQEEAVAVLPLPGGVVAEARRRGHAETSDRLPGRGESKFRIVNEVARDRDLGVACCHRAAPGRYRDLGG